MVALIVHMKVKTGSEEEVKRLIRAMEENTRKEPGCIQYVGHQSTEDPSSFAFYEEYADEAALHLHWNSEHFSKYIKNGVDHHVVERQKHLFRPVSPLVGS
ncbi:MAG TPA: putative quinol monooxygenase [Clostridia bacterium]|nr:putative quinol monooxygenase [Clostridia bacterium]